MDIFLDSNQAVKSWEWSFETDQLNVIHNVASRIIIDMRKTGLIIELPLTSTFAWRRASEEYVLSTQDRRLILKCSQASP
jgi:hypothetical protein